MKICLHERSLLYKDNFSRVITVQDSTKTNYKLATKGNLFTVMIKNKF